MSNSAQTVPAPSAPSAQPAHLPSALTLAAIEAGVSVDDAHAYNAGRETYKVKFYCPKTSRKGAGVRGSYFSSLAEAETFAAGKILYARPAKVETLRPLSVEQLRAVATR